MMRVVLFLFTNLAVILIFGLILGLIGIQFGNIYELLIIALLFGLGGSLVSLFMSKWIALKSIDGNIIKQPHNDTEYWIINTVTSQAQRVGIATPQVAIYHATDMNAFATGAYRNSSLVAFSTGLLQNMKKDETEAVIAHEISHINNGDMVTMTLIQGIINTFVIFASRIIAQIVTDFFSHDHDRDNKKDSNNNILIYTTIVIILELVFGIIASIITMWFSRHREFRADSDSAKLVGYEKMIAALQRLKTSCDPQESLNIMTLCINGKTKSLISELFMTHPSLDKRIEALRNEQRREID